MDGAWEKSVGGVDVNNENEKRGFGSTCSAESEEHQDTKVGENHPTA